MVKLTEEMVIARTKQSNLSSITKLNCWGASITDVNILKHMPNVTVLALSVNNISSLEVFKWCQKLQELFVRKNNITRLNEVCYLQDLPHLKTLWLDQNPCVKDPKDDEYRLSVIKTLPRLKKLDDTLVEVNEVERALQYKWILAHPELQYEDLNSEPDSDEKECPDNDLQSSSEVTWEQQKDDQIPHDQNEASRIEQNVRGLDSRSQAEKYPVDNSARSHTDLPRRYGRDGQNYQPDPRQGVEYAARCNDEFNSRPEQSRAEYSVERDSPEPQGWQESPHNENEHSEDVEVLLPNNCRDQDASRETEVLTRSTSFKNDFPANNARGGHYSSIPRSRTSDEFGYCRRNNFRTVVNCSNNCKRRPADRRTNILNAVLCLVKELDYENLVVVDHAVKCRMDELEG